MTKSKLLSTLLVLLIASGLIAQDRNYARFLIDSLASPFMFGRGYVNKGDSLAAEFVASQYEKIGLQSFGEDYYQPFTLNVNTFPGRVDVKINSKRLKPGEEYVLRPASHSDQGSYPVRVLNCKILKKPGKLERFFRRDNSGHYIFYDIDMKGIQSRDTLRMIDSLIRNNLAGSRGSVFTRAAISWHVWARDMHDKPFTSVDVHRDVMPRKPKRIGIDAENMWISGYRARNVIGWVPGKYAPDSFLVVTAHYDHLGMMGRETLFPGANDNASGTAMLIDLARHYNKPENQPHYSMAFMAFAGEEAGLLGSKHYTENPFFPLENIVFLINLDMVGTGSDGLLVFNGSTDTVRFEIMNNINTDRQYLKELRMRGVSRNSDHYYFHHKGVPAFFLLTMGQEHRHYHDIWDTREATPLTKYDEVFRLIVDFFKTF